MRVLIFLATIGIFLWITSCQKDTTKNGKSSVTNSLTDLENSRKHELEEANTQRQYDAINRKYKVLRKELKYIQKESSFKFGLDDDLQALSKPSIRSDFTKSYHPLSLQSVKKVIRDFGELYVKETRGKTGDLTYEVLNVEQPWSGYWYPFTDRTLYEGDEAPLLKLDLALRNLGFDSNIAGEQARRFEGFRPDSWEGFCDGWSFAAILVPEPRSPKVIAGIEFSISDQKAISTFGHINFPSEMYGIKYLGNSKTDGSYQDLRPEGFHRVVTQVLGMRGQALVIDDTPGVQVWNKPLYSYRWQITQDPDRDYAYLVKAYAWLVKERWSPDEEMTSIRDVVAPVYSYRLYVDKETQNSNGEYKVIAGEWIGDSEENHPGNARVANEDAEIYSDNKEFYKHRKTIKSLFFNKN